MKFLARLADFVGWSLSLLLILRFVMRLFSASTVAPFVKWLYGFTSTLMLPFVGIFPSPKITAKSVVDIPAIVAAIVYFIAAYLIAMLIESLGDGSMRLRRPGSSARPMPPQGHSMQPPAQQTSM